MNINHPVRKRPPLQFGGELATPRLLRSHPSPQERGKFVIQEG